MREAMKRVEGVWKVVIAGKRTGDQSIHDNKLFHCNNSVQSVPMRARGGRNDRRARSRVHAVVWFDVLCALQGERRCIDIVATARGKQVILGKSQRVTIACVDRHKLRVVVI